MTVLEVLQSSTAYFTKRGIENPRLNAEHLIAHGLGLKRLDVYLAFERQLSEPELSPLRELVRRRGQNEPLQHLLGTVEFCHQTFLCDRRALVPRPETEELVELTKSAAPQPASILDLGTGSGVIALSLAGIFPEAKIVAVDISPEALLLAKENAARLSISNVEFRSSDLLSDFHESFDVIVANLPYVSETDRDELAPEVLRDPEIALFGGKNGDELIRQLIETAPKNLNPGGLLALEIGLGQSEGLSEFLRAQNYHDITVKKDYAGVTRFLFARYG